MRELPRNLYEFKQKGKVAAYQVSITISGERTVKNFSFKSHKTEERAYKSAYEFLEKLCDKNGIELQPRVQPSDTPGVTRTERTDKSSGREVVKAHWQATWQSKPGKQETRRFSIATHGEAKAKQLAIEEREHAINSIKLGKDPIFRPPKSKKTKLWRYMDFTKFVSMLENSGVYFSQVDLLGDPYEGAYSLGNEKNRNFVYSRSDKQKKSVDELVKQIKRRRPGIMISCWHQSNHESAAMWKLYAKSNEAVCIQTTYGKLSQSLGDSVSIGNVKYIDYEKHWIPERSIYFPFLYKRKSFEHERELRAIIDMKELKQKDLLMGNKFGIWRPVDLNMLINTVYVSPDSPAWFHELTKNILHKYKINCSVVNSRLSGEPIY